MNAEERASGFFMTPMDAGNENKEARTGATIVGRGIL